LKQGEKISNVVNASQESYSFTFDSLQKTLKRISKTFAKTKHVVQAWSKILKIKETIHAYLMNLYWLNSK
jgi:ADP-glucose pyrophosphorylase